EQQQKGRGGASRPTRPLGRRLGSHLFSLPDAHVRTPNLESSCAVPHCGGAGAPTPGRTSSLAATPRQLKLGKVATTQGEGLDQPAIKPPSTSTSEPVVKEDASDSSQTTASATSRGCPSRPSGICALSLAMARSGSGRPLMSALTMSPSMKAGCTEL